MILYDKGRCIVVSTFSENLVKFRQNNNLSRKELADVLQVTVQTYGAYENGKREPNIDKLCKIAAALHLSIDELLGYETNPKDIDYWRKYLADTKLRIIEDEKEIILIPGGDIGEKQYWTDRKSGVKSYPRATFPTKEDFFQFMTDMEEAAKQSQKAFLLRSIQIYMRVESNLQTKESLKELESYHP